MGTAEERVRREEATRASHPARQGLHGDGPTRKDCTRDMLRTATEEPRSYVRTNS